MAIICDHLRSSAALPVRSTDPENLYGFAPEPTDFHAELGFRETHCQHTQDLNLGTRLDTTCGIVIATLDGGAPVTLDCYYPVATTSQTRRLLFSGVAAGQHRVVITLSGFFLSPRHVASIGDRPRLTKSCSSDGYD